MKDAHWLDDPANVRLLRRAFLAVLAVLVLAGVFVAGHPHFAVDAIFGFHAFYGFIACLAMIATAKVVGWWLKRSDTYYGEAHDD